MFRLRDEDRFALLVASLNMTGLRRLHRALLHRQSFLSPLRGFGRSCVKEPYLPGQDNRFLVALLLGITNSILL
jgi:hypothetical protein